MSTGIQWTDETWNPVVGCTKVSQGCKNCYAKTIHDMRHKAFMAGKKGIAPQYAVPFETVQLMPERLLDPIGWQRPRRVFVNSVSDLFHEDIPDDYIDKVFAIMAFADRHTFQVLTKRPERMRDYMRGPGLRERIAAAANTIMRARATTRGLSSALSYRFMWRSCDSIDPGPWANRLSGIADNQWPLPNVWLGVSVERQQEANERIPLLAETIATVRFLSCEPLLGEIDLAAAHPCGYYCAPDPIVPNNSVTDWRDGHYDHAFLSSGVKPAIDWVIVGGESGAKARNCDIRWIRSIVKQCREAATPVFVKQVGAAVVVPYPGQSYYDGENFIDDHALWLPHHSHGGDPEEWPLDLRVREWPEPVAA